MQALLDDLGQANSLYRNMYESSTNSTGSAMEENERFMESLQARINLARVEVEKLALAMGGAFMTESMIQGLKLFGDFLGTTTKFVDKFGVLPTLMGSTGVAIFLLSTGFRNLSTSVGSSVVSLLGFRGAATATATASTLTASAVRGLSTAFKGLLASTGVGLVLVGVGVAIESLLGSMAKQREIQEEIYKENRNLIESYTASRNEIQALTSEYRTLEESMSKASPDTDTQQRYYEVQNKLAELMPNLVKYEDSYGNKIIGSSTVINSKIALLEKQIQTEEKLQEIQNRETDQEKQKQSEKDLKSNRALAEQMRDEFTRKAGSFLTGFAYKEDIQNLQDMETALAHFVTKKKELLDEGQTEKTPVVVEVTDTIEDLQRLLNRYNSYSSEMESAQSYLTNKYAENAEKLILENRNIEDSTKDLANSMLYDFTAMANSSKEAKSISDVFGDGNFQKSLEEATKQINIFTSSTSENFENQKKSFLEYAEAMKSSILSDMKGSNGAPLAEDSKAYKNVEQSIDSYVDKLILREQAIRNTMEAEGQSREQALLSIQALGDMENSQEGLTETLSAYVNKLYEKASAEEQVAGVTQNLLTEADNLIFLYQTLSTQTSLTADQLLALKDAEEKLMAIYPQLSKNGELRIDTIVAERNAQDILLKAVKASKDGQLTYEEQTTVGHLLETNARISIINAEIEAAQKLANAYSSVYDSVVSAAKNGDESAAKLLMRISVPTVKAQTAQAELATLEKTRSGYVSDLSGVIDNLDSSTKSNTKSTKDSTKATKDSTYITDKYKQELETVNLEIEKQQKLRSDMTDFSEQYRDSLQKEIELEKQKSKLMQDQAASLQAQIKSGKIIQTGNVSSSTSSQKLNGWNGNITSNYGTRSDPFTGKKTRHDGIDIAGSKGQRIDANVGGKVVFAGKGTGSSAGLGNYVTIQAEDGMKHIYAHLDKVVATLGQTITSGMQVGNIGSTGRSTNNHLHYQTKDASGKSVDPTSYLQSAKDGGLVSGASNAQQAIDQAKSDLLSLQGSILNSQETIAKLELEVINSQLGEFDNSRKLYQHTLDYEAAKQEAISQTGKEYRTSIDKQISAMRGQQSANQAELKFLDNLIANGKLSAVTMTEMKDRVKALKVEMLQLGSAIEDANFEKITSRMVAFDESQDDLQFLVDLTGEYMNSLTEGSEEYNKAANEQIAAMQKQQRMIRTQIDEHKNDLATKKLGVQQTKDLKEKIEDLTIAYYSLGNGIKSTSKSLEESNERMKNEVADKLIDAYKNYTEERRDAHMKTIDAEMKAEEKRHKQISDNLSKELDAYKKIIQAKLDMLDKEESERDYNKEIDDLEKERLDILNKISLLSMDDSFEARKEAANLTEKLNATDEQIAEKRHDREIELRKENLNDLLTSKEEEIKNRQELEDQRYEHEKELIDKQKEYWEQYYNDLLNDERKFAKIRKDVVSGNFDEIKKEFSGYLEYLVETMPELGNTLDGTMQAVGTSIRQNMIDNLKEALDLMNQIGKTTPSNGGNNQFESDKGNATPPTKPNTPSTPSPGGAGGKKGTITVTKPINLWERERGSDKMKMVRILQPGEKYNVYGEETRSSFGKQYDVGANKWITDMPGYVKYAKFEKGGFTGKQEGWAQLHEEEFVLNKGMTKEALKMADLFSNLNRLINPLRMQPINPPQLAGTSGNGDINLEFNIDKMIANDKEADSFSKRIGDNLKRLKGLK